MAAAIHAPCPNCGHELHTLRHDRQAAGPRDVHLHWLICPGCTHVALFKWGFVDDVDGDEPLMYEERPRRSDRPKSE